MEKEGKLFVFIELFLTMIQVGPVLVSEEKTVAKLAEPVHSFAAISDASKKIHLATLLKCLHI